MSFKPYLQTSTSKQTNKQKPLLWFINRFDIFPDFERGSENFYLLSGLFFHEQGEDWRVILDVNVNPFNPKTLTERV